jgi:hypothetical protein
MIAKKILELLLSIYRCPKAEEMGFLLQSWIAIMDYYGL